MSRTPTLKTNGVQNLGELQKLFRRVPSVVNKGLPSVVRAAIAPYGSQMRKNLGPRHRSGTTAKSIKARVIQYASGVVFGIAGVSRDVVGEYRGKRVVPAFIAHFIEFGTKPHAIGKGSYLKRAGRSKPQTQSGRLHPGAKAYPFRGPALQAAAAQSARNAEKQLERVVEKSLEGIV